MSAAPTVARPESTSPSSRNEVIQANTGSIAKIRAVRVGLVQRCAQVWMENAERGSKKTGDGQRADQRKAPWMRTGSAHQNVSCAHSGASGDLGDDENAHIRFGWRSVP